MKKDKERGAWRRGDRKEVIEKDKERRTERNREEREREASEG